MPKCTVKKHGWLTVDQRKPSNDWYRPVSSPILQHQGYRSQTALLLTGSRPRLIKRGPFRFAIPFSGITVGGVSHEQVLGPNLSFYPVTSLLLSSAQPCLLLMTLFFIVLFVTGCLATQTPTSTMAVRSPVHLQATIPAAPTVTLHFRPRNSSSNIFWEITHSSHVRLIQISLLDSTDGLSNTSSFCRSFISQYASSAAFLHARTPSPDA